MNCSRNETEKPNKQSAETVVFSPEPNHAKNVPIQLEDETFDALAIARIETEGGLTLP